MAYTWGSTTLIVKKGTYNPPHRAEKLQEIQVLPGGGTAPDSVLHEPPRARIRVSFSGYCIGTSAYEALLADFVGRTERIFDDDNFSDTMLIEDLSPAVRESDDIYAYTIALVEA